jgi:hypothetical protein
LRRPQVEEGNIDAARKYYSETVSPQLKFLTPATIANPSSSSIKDLLAYFGYTNIAAKDLHRLSSDEIMNLSAAGDILATRFFAPKITAVSANPPQVPAGGFGWRKLVRLKAKPDSAAAQNGMDLLLILQNIFEKTITGNPFNADQNVSKFNQVIVTRKQGPFSPSQQPAYFLAYSPLVKLSGSSGLPIKDASGNFQDDGVISFSLKATFDEKARDPETNVLLSEYFVPGSCVQCHGGVTTRGKANYLDTDHWIDRVRPNYGLSESRFKEEDFTALANSPYDVIFDGEKDAAKTQKAFEVIRLLNEDIRNQNSLLGTANNFQLNAVERWLELHKAANFGSGHAPPYARGFGNQPWDPNSETDKKLVYYLNRYCYRCHSSVKYSVFDRTAVVGRIGVIPGRVLDISDQTSWMPQDRIFPGLAVGQISGEGVPTRNLKEFLDLLALAQP